MFRRQLLPVSGVDDRLASARKTRTTQGYTRPGRYWHGSRELLRPTVPETWIGKQIVYWNGDTQGDYVAAVRAAKGYTTQVAQVSEMTIAAYARPQIYRILYARTLKNGTYRIVSKYNRALQPSRLNVIVDERGIIVAVEYF